MNNKTKYILPPIVIVLGIVLGGLAKAGDVAVQGDILGNILHAFGTVSSGFFIWVFFCTAIAILSQNKIWSAVNVFLFLSAMIFAYYLYSHFIVNYFVWRVVKFWLVMLIPSMILGVIVWHVRTIRILKYIVIALGTVTMFFDIIGASPISLIIYIILYAAFLALILSRRLTKLE